MLQAKSGRHLLLSATAALLLPGVAQADAICSCFQLISIPLLTNFSGITASGQNSTTFSQVNVSQTVNTTLGPFPAYTTRILATLNGNSVVSDQTYTAVFADPTVQSGISNARMSLVRSGGPLVAISGPTLISSNTGSSTSLVNVQTGYSYSNPVVTTYQGPQTIGVGNNQAYTWVIAPGGTDTDNLYTYTTTTTNTYQTTTTLSETYGLNGTARPLGFGHTAAQSALLGVGANFADRIVEIGAPGGPAVVQFDIASNSDSFPVPSPHGHLLAWSDVYDVWSKTGGSGRRPGEGATSSGVSAGFGAQLNEEATLGIAVSQGRTVAKTLGLGDSAATSLTQFGPWAQYRLGQLRLSGGVFYGTGTTNSISAADLPGQTTSGRYGVQLWGGSLEARYRMTDGPLSISPKFGGDLVQIRSASFTETGPQALVANAGQVTRTRIWAGANLAQEVSFSWGKLDLSGQARLVDVLSGRDTSLTMGYAFAPGTTTTLHGVTAEAISVETGIRVGMPLTRLLSLAVAYDGGFANRAQSHVATLGLRLIW
jgi:hypothetical protein